MTNHRGSRLFFGLMLLLSVDCQSVQVHDDGKRWGDAESIEEEGLRWSTAPQVAIDADGSAVAVWDESSNLTLASDDIWSNRAAPIDGWDATKAESIENNEDEGNGGDIARDPQLAIDSEGNVVVVWRQRVSSGMPYQIWSNRYLPSGGWDPARAERIGSAVPGAEVQPQVAIDPKGNAIAVWAKFDEARGRFDVRSNRYELGTWGAARPVSTDNSGDASGPQVVMDSNGNGIAVWEQVVGNRNRSVVYSARWNGDWGTPQPIDDDNAGNAEDPEIAVDAEGNAIAVWGQSGNRSEDERFDIWSNRYTPSDNRWGVPELVETDDAGSASDPQVAMAPSGDAVAVWVQFDGRRFDIWSNRYTLDVGWGRPERIETENRGQGSTPQVAMDPSGSAVVVWTQFDGVQFAIWSNRYTPRGGWGGHESIDVDDPGRSWQPQVAMDRDGIAIAVWAHQEEVGDRFEIWSNRLEPVPDPVAPITMAAE
jgi:hypothetical protein